MNIGFTNVAWQTILQTQLTILKKRKVKKDKNKKENIN